MKLDTLNANMVGVSSTTRAEQFGLITEGNPRNNGIELSVVQEPIIATRITSPRKDQIFDATNCKPEDLESTKPKKLLTFQTGDQFYNFLIDEGHTAAQIADHVSKSIWTFKQDLQDKIVTQAMIDDARLTAELAFSTHEDERARARIRYSQQSKNSPTYFITDQLIADRYAQNLGY